MRNLPFFSCLLESYGYNFIHLRSSALCCGCHGAFGSGQIKRTCSSHPQPEPSAAPRPSLRTDPEVLVVFLIGQGRKRQLAINQLIPSTSFFYFFSYFRSYTSSTWIIRWPAVFSFNDLNLFFFLPFIASVRPDWKVVWMH